MHTYTYILATVIIVKRHHKQDGWRTKKYLNKRVKIILINS